MTYRYRKLLVDGRQVIGWVCNSTTVILSKKEGIIIGGLLWTPKHAARIARQLRSRGRQVRVVVTQEI